VSEGGRRVEVTVDKLREISLFAEVAEPQLAILARRFVPAEAQAGEVVFREGDEGELFYVIVRGSVIVSRLDESGQPMELARLADGDQFGELALLHDGLRNATVTARTDCLFLTLTRAHFLEMLRTAPDLRAMVERLANERVGDGARLATA